MTAAEADLYSRLMAAALRQDAMTSDEIAAANATYAPARVDLKGIAVGVRRKCKRCGGHGRIGCFAHVAGGECFACNGSGHE